MKKITAKQLLSVLVLYTATTAQVINLYPGSDVNLWFSALIGAAASLPVILMYGAISVLCPGTGLFGALRETLGKSVGTAISLFYIAYAVFVASVTLRYLSEFIRVVSLTDTPQWLILALFGTLCGYAAANGIGVSARLAAAVFPAIIAIFLFIVFCSADFYDISNVVPGLEESVETFADSAFAISSFGFCEAVFMLEPLKECPLPPKKKYLTLTAGLVLSALFVSALMLSDKLILGNSVSILYFPHYEAVSVINVGDFITHIEVISILSFLLCVVVKDSVCLHTASEGLSVLFPKAKRAILTAAVTFAASACAPFLFGSTVEMYSFHAANRIATVVFQVVVPFAVFAVAAAKKACKS